jgi:hypothetical protein
MFLISLVLSILSAVTPLRASPTLFAVVSRDGHGHHKAPLLELNETEILMYHDPTPPSYASVDFAPFDPAVTRHPGLIVSHVIFISLAFFVALPIGLYSSFCPQVVKLIMSYGSYRNAFCWSLMACVSYCHVLLPFHPWLGCWCLVCKTYAKHVRLYNSTDFEGFNFIRRYDGSCHGSHGSFILLVAFFLPLFDVLVLVRRVLVYFKKGGKFTLKAFWRAVILNHVVRPDIDVDYTELSAESPGELDAAIEHGHSAEEIQLLHKADFEGDLGQDNQWARVHSGHRRSGSTTSEQTLIPPAARDSDDDLNVPTRKPSLLRRAGVVILATLERALVFAAWELLLTGVVTYTGICRGNYINGCMAHFISTLNV